MSLESELQNSSTLGLRGNVQRDLSPGPPPRSKSRSPHPYSRRKFEPYSGQPVDPQTEYQSSENPVSEQDTSDRALGDEAARTPEGWTPLHNSKSLSDSGTEADDESYTFLKGLPAPPVKLRKGLRDTRGEGIERALTPPFLSDDARRYSTDFREALGLPRSAVDTEEQKAAEKARRIVRGERIRRGLEFGLVACIGVFILCGRVVRKALTVGVTSSDILRSGKLPGSAEYSYPIDPPRHKVELVCHFLVVVSLLLLYPTRIILSHGKSLPLSWSGLRGAFRIPSTYDPAPIVYPILLPVYVALSLLSNDQRFLTANLTLSIASLPKQLIPFGNQGPGYNIFHWCLTMVPRLGSGWSTFIGRYNPTTIRMAENTLYGVGAEQLVCLYPLHQALLPVLHYLTTTSLLPAELQLLSISLINLLIHSSSPQAIILEVLLWGGGISIFVFCGHVLRWGVALARIPKWRFRRAGQVVRANNAFLGLLRAIQGKNGFRLVSLGRRNIVEESGDDEQDERSITGDRPRHKLRLHTRNVNGTAIALGDAKEAQSAIDDIRGPDRSEHNQEQDQQSFSHRRRHTLSSFTAPLPLLKPAKQLSPERRKRRSYSSVQSYLALTPAQANTRKWLYAIYVYIVILITVLVGIRTCVSRKALNGHEPIGWAIGYMFGNIPPFRLFVVQWNLDRWICLPSFPEDTLSYPTIGLLPRLREYTLGVANTRLLLSAYYLAILTLGLTTVFAIGALVEVDTRRKVFHFTITAILLPSTYIDPAFTALALELVLAAFLLLDLLRASQLPPVSKPLAYFLTPYVDGRDLRGPVVVSHIFLLIGCAIPLWLSLAGTPRTGSGCAEGWELPRREIGMVSGVVCVGMGDAAASLFGRRFGRRKWIWRGGKSVEGSVAFVVAVWAGLIFGRAWLQLGGWTSGDGMDGWLLASAKMAVAACGASLTEAVLTGGNDNVVVPVILWLFVKGLGI